MFRSLTIIALFALLPGCEKVSAQSQSSEELAEKITNLKPLTLGQYTAAENARARALDERLDKMSATLTKISEELRAMRRDAEQAGASRPAASNAGGPR